MKTFQLNLVTDTKMRSGQIKINAIKFKCIKIKRLTEKKKSPDLVTFIFNKLAIKHQHPYQKIISAD